MFEFTRTHIPGVVLIEPRVHNDARGCFYESWSKEPFRRAGIDYDFLQDNHSVSKRGVLRGLHFQRPPHAQAKLVRVVSGAVFDVAVDLREGSHTYGRSVCAVLSGENKRQLFIPQGCAHGFLVLSDTAEFCYKCSAPYHPESEGGVRYDDPTISIRWPITPKLIAKKDLSLPYLHATTDFPIAAQI